LEELNWQKQLNAKSFWRRLMKKKKVIEQMEEIVKDITTVEEIAEIERMISEVKGKFPEARPREEVGLGYAGRIFKKTREIMHDTGMGP
jgi:hypothetical protein